MCLATLSVVGAVGAVASAGSLVMGGIAASNNANYQAQVAQNNAQIAQQNANAAMAAGAQKVQMEGMKNAAKMGAVKAAQAANGVDVNTGSNVDVQVSERQIGDLDEQQTQHNAQLQAYGYRTQASNFQAEAGLDQARADQAIPGSILSAGGGLLSSASGINFKWGSGGSSSSSASNSYSDYNQTGLPGNVVTG